MDLCFFFFFVLNADISVADKRKGFVPEYIIEALKSNQATN